MMEETSVTRGKRERLLAEGLSILLEVHDRGGNCTLSPDCYPRYREALREYFREQNERASRREKEHERR